MSYNRELLLGCWYRDGIDEQGTHYSEQAQLAIDGSFEFTFITFNDHGVMTNQQTELGDWGLVGDIHFTMTKSEIVEKQHYAADGCDSNNYHAYRVIELNGQRFIYQHIVTEEIYTLRRVIDNVGHC